MAKIVLSGMEKVLSEAEKVLSQADKTTSRANQTASEAAGGGMPRASDQVAAARAGADVI